MGAIGAAGVTVSAIIEDHMPGRRTDSDGYVTYSNVDMVDERVNMISVSRSYQNNVEVMNTTKTLLLKTLQMGS